MQVLLVGALPEYGCVSSKNPDILLHAADNSLRFSAAKICPTDFLVSLGIGDARKAEFGLESGGFNTTILQQAQATKLALDVNPSLLGTSNMKMQRGSGDYYLRNSIVSCCLASKSLDYQRGVDWHTNCHGFSEMKRWVQIVLLIGLLTVSVAPWDADPASVSDSAVIVSATSPTGSFATKVNVANNSKLILPSARSFAEANSYAPGSRPIIDLTCARLC